MSRISLLGAMLAVLVAAGATILTFKLTKPVAARHHTDAAGPIHPAPLSTPWQFNKPWQDLREEEALP